MRGPVLEPGGGAGGAQEELKDEVLRMAKQVNVAGFNLLCIDTENQFVTTGFGKEIAQVPPPTTAPVSASPLTHAPEHTFAWRCYRELPAALS